MTDTSTTEAPAPVPAKPKWFLQSKTLIGVILTALPIVLPILGIGFSADDQVMVSELVDTAFQFIGMALVTYARFKDGGEITVTPS